MVKKGSTMAAVECDIIEAEAEAGGENKGRNCTE